MKKRSVLDVQDIGIYEILDFDGIRFALRKESVIFVDFMEWIAGVREAAVEARQALARTTYSKKDIKFFYRTGILG
ncbi:MAG: hypothetical protein HFH60_10460 [Lachnospiraceae bacterium]|nr:hypothetical protein [Lachnospiraceae bacterium]